MDTYDSTTCIEEKSDSMNLKEETILKDNNFTIGIVHLF